MPAPVWSSAVAATSIVPLTVWPGVGVTKLVIGPAACAKVALYVLAVAGAVMLCVAAPLSDQLENVYDVPATVCGEGALTEFAEPTTTVFVNGVLADEPPTVSFKPVGEDVSVRSTVFGCSVTLVVDEPPPLSVAVICSSRCDG